MRAFELLAKGEIAKESLEIIFESIMSEKSQSVEDAIQKTAIAKVSSEDLEQVLDDIINANLKVINESGLRSLDPLMGIAMKTLRGKVDGKKINVLLEKKIKAKLDSSQKLS